MGESANGLLPGDYPHRRYNPLLDEWVLVSAHRASRPWQGLTEPDAPRVLPPYDADCYLCPGNERAGGHRNPAYKSTYVFTNDFPALLPDVVARAGNRHPLLRWESTAGTCRVICFSPQHDLSLAQMSAGSVREVIDLWASQIGELSARYPWVEVFENKGELMGCSNAHPHGQIWASGEVPTLVAKEERQQLAYFSAHGAPLLFEYGELEHKRAERLVVANDGWLATVPFWAVWPFETILLPRRPVSRLPDLAEQERAGLASLLIALLNKYDNMFNAPFPYSMGWHGAPGDGREHPEWQLHAHIYPPLLRSATVRKFMVGYEMFAEAQRDLTPEQAAERIRRQPASCPAAKRGRGLGNA